MPAEPHPHTAQDALRQPVQAPRPVQLAVVLCLLLAVLLGARFALEAFQGTLSALRALWYGALWLGIVLLNAPSLFARSARGYAVIAVVAGVTMVGSLPGTVNGLFRVLHSADRTELVTWFSLALHALQLVASAVLALLLLSRPVRIFVWPKRTDPPVASTH